MQKIDFVVTWVDGNDPEWQAERAKYSPDKGTADGSVIRYRDWGLMRYWFRGVEKFAPWVNKIYFVTSGHYPEWLNLEHPKLVHIKHTDYIPAENLPTFNSNVIELYMHNIPGLSEQFVLFNDDMFLTDYVKETDFFRNGLPCETAILGQTFAMATEDVFAYTMFNNIAIINKHFSKKEVTKKHWKKFFSLCYGKALLRNALLLPFGHFSGFLDSHLPASHLKSTFYELWREERQALAECGTHRFRNKGDLTHWLMKDWRICKGQFVPRSINWGKSFSIGHNPEMISAIKERKYKIVCLNDCDPELDFETNNWKLVTAFETILPQKSEYEK